MRTVLTRADWARIQELFDASIDMPPDMRTAYLREACTDRPDLPPRVEALIRSVGGDDLIGAAVLEAAQDADNALLPSPGDRIGSYEITRIIGRGGMGVVYEAFRADDQYEKNVAIKLVGGGLLTRDLLPRFRAERQILANLEHPHIARLLDGGTTAAGLPYVVLEYVDGKPLDEYCRDQGLDIRQRLRLMVDVARAVQYAHQNLVVHRDLKPGNVLVTGEGFPKLLDFGIAKLVELEAESDPGTLRPQTIETSRMMTPEYASPEQITGKRVSTASDVYQLGVILHELLAGERPFRAKAFLGPGELERAICERPAPRLKVNTDIDRIVCKAMEKEPAQRYASAGELANDIELFLNGFPVQARPAGWRYRAAKFIARNRAAVAAVSIFVLLIVALAISMMVLARRARAEAATSAQISNFLMGLFENSGPDSGGPDKITARSLMDKGVLRIEKELKDNPLVQARLYDMIGGFYTQMGLFQPARETLAKCLELRRRMGANDPAQATTSANLGELSYELAKFEDAEKYYREASRINLASGGPENPNLVADYTALTAILQSLNRFEEAEAMGRKSVELSLKVYGRENEHTALAMNNLKSVFLKRGDYLNTEKMARDAYEIAKKIFPEGRQTAMFEGNLSHILNILGRYPEAERHALEASRLIGQSTGANSPAMNVRRVVLAEILLSLGKEQEALESARQAYEGHLKVLGPAHSDTRFAAETYATALSATGDPARGRALCHESLAMREKILGDSPLTAVVLTRCARIDMDLNDLAAANDGVRHAMRIREVSDGRSSTVYAESAVVLAELLVRRGELAEAESLANESLPVLERALPPVHPTIARCRAALAATQVQRSQTRSAELMQQAYDAFVSTYGLAHRETARFGIRLASCLKKASDGSAATTSRIKELVSRFEPVVRRAGMATRFEQQMLTELHRQGI